MPRERAHHSKYPLPTTQEKTTHGHHQTLHTEIRMTSLQPKMEKNYIVSKTSLEVDCGSDPELLIAKFRLKLNKVGKTTTFQKREFQKNI